MRSVAWSSFNKPVQLTSHTMVLTSGFVYGPDRARIRQRVIDGTSRKTVYYVGGVLGSLRSPAFGSERHVKDHADDEEIHYIWNYRDSILISRQRPETLKETGSATRPAGCTATTSAPSTYLRGA